MLMIGEILAVRTWINVELEKEIVMMIMSASKVYFVDQTIVVQIIMIQMIVVIKEQTNQFLCLTLSNR